MISIFDILATVPAAESESGLGGILKNFNVTWPLFLSQVASFLIVAALLKKFAFGPVQSMLEQRRNRIADGEKMLKVIEKQLADAAKTSAEAIAKANEDAVRLINEAMHSASALSEQSAQEALAQAQNIINKAEAASKAFAWSDKASFEGLPQSGTFGTIGDETFAVSEVEIQVSEQAGTWTFRARGADSGILGPSITTKGAPAAGQSYSAPMGSNEGVYFQTPRPGRSVGTKDFSDTVDLTTDSAYAIEIATMTLSADGKTGTASGRFVTMFKDAGSDFPAMRAAGNFKNATVRVWKK